MKLIRRICRSTPSALPCAGSSTSTKRSGHPHHALADGDRRRMPGRRSQHKNRARPMTIPPFHACMKRSGAKQNRAHAAERKASGTGDRSERIRTTTFQGPPDGSPHQPDAIQARAGIKRQSGRDHRRSHYRRPDGEIEFGRRMHHRSPRSNAVLRRQQF